MNTGFIATSIQRIARKRRTTSLVLLGAIFISVCCSLGLVWLMQFPDALWLYLFVITCGLIICGLVLRSVMILSRAIRNPLESFFLNPLKRYGPLQQTIEQIDREAGPYVGKIGSFVTQYWVISPLSNSLNCMRIDDIVWIYKRVAESRVSFYYAVTVSSGKSYVAQIWSRSGYCLSIPSTEKGVDGLLEAIAKNAPWITQGYTELTNEAWMSQRANFIAAVDQRRQQLLFLTSDANVGKSGDNQSPSGWDVKPGAQSFLGSINQPAPFGLNHPVNEELIESYQRRQDRKLRAIGCLLLFSGFVLSAIFILPLISGVLENAKEIPFSREGVLLSMVLLMFGGYYSVFGRKGKGFFENTFFKNWWSIALLVVVTCIGFLIFKSILEALLRFFGYGF